ncbi:unnamed protein product [Paramecium sonneborni]|uniref:Transmembrane protein n=1 Tax=Paramecium sonneborni TaxID=65129 RepID=A0A8S1RCA9_9CILI|nr:unnamed protein product [Paramecium sonneborni]
MQSILNLLSNIIKATLILKFVVLQSNACPFNSYDDALNQANVYNIDSFIQNADGDSIGFGFWSYSIPQLSPKILAQEEQGNSLMAENGQFLFLIKKESLNLVLGYFSSSLSQKLAFHNLVFYQTPQVIQQFVFSPQKYIAHWILTTIVYNFKSQEFIINSNQKQFIQFFDLTQTSQTSIQIYFGGKDLIAESFNLNEFNGKLSKIFIERFNYLEFNFIDYIVQFCIVPKQIQEEQIVYLVKGLKIFQGDTLLTPTIYQIGNRYCISGWMKYDFSKVIDDMVYLVFRIASQKYYNKDTNIGDSIFKLQVEVKKTDTRYCRLIVLNNLFYVPAGGPIPIGDNLQIQILNDFYVRDSYYNGLQQWHFLKFEQGSEVVNVDEGRLIQVQFFNELNLVEKKVKLSGPSDQLFYFFIGGDDFTKQQLDAQIYDLKFEYNYNVDKTILLNACHYSCLTCNGPFEDNCLSCISTSNRNYIKEQNKCICNYGYIDYDGQSICVEFQLIFQSVQLNEIEMKSYTTCEQGYFILPNYLTQNICQQCPQNNYGKISCVDCKYYPENWYLKPICTADLLSRYIERDDGFYYKERNLIDYDLYIIDENGQVILQRGVLDFCNIEIDQESCFKYKHLHLGQSIYVKCKPNYYQFNGECLFTSIYCLETDKLGHCLKIIDGIYEKNGEYKACPSNCLTCNYDATLKQIQCLSCQDFHSLVSGECIKCGNFCKNCQIYDDSNIQQSYLKCFKCIDDSKYYISFDAVNCNENKINSCFYAFEVIKNDPTQNTIDLYFIPRYDQENIVIYCGRCKFGYIFVIEINKCLLSFDENCYYSYSQATCTNSDDFPESLEDRQQMVDSNSHYQLDDGDYITIPNENDYRCLTVSYCIILEDYQPSDVYKIVQYSLTCPSYNKNCVTCLKERNLMVDFCLECDSGYYAHRITGKCYQCPKELNCFQCQQQLIISEDSWKIQIRAFYQVVINQNKNHFFQQYAQSQDINDYIISCTICLQGYQLINNLCIPACSETCLECNYMNGLNQCIRCKTEFQGRRLTISNNVCVKCPENCALCRQREMYQIKQINPLFNNQKYLEFTYQCLKSYENDIYEFDFDLGSYLKCPLGSKPCQRNLFIKIYLHCDESLYWEEFNQKQTVDEQNLFRQQNILLQDLISDSSFKEFEKDEFYSQANQQLIKTIEIQIVSKKSQICIITGNATIQQQFSQNIFSANSVNLNMIFDYQTIFIFERMFTFLNFQNIDIQGATFQPASNNRQKTILFQSAKQQSIILNKIIFQQTSLDYDQSEIIFENTQKLFVNNTKIIDFKQKYVNYLFLLNQTNYIKNIAIQNVQIFSSIFENQITFLFLIKDKDYVEIKDIQIEAILINTTLLDTNNTDIGSIIINNLKLQIQAKDSLKIFNLYSFNSILISGFFCLNSNFYNSTLIALNNNAYIQDFTVQFCEFKEFTYVLVNFDQLSETSQNFIIKNTIFDQNVYDQSVKFICLNKWNHQFSNLQIQKFQLLNNHISNVSSDLNLNTIEIQLVYLKMDNLKIEELIIERGYGIIEICITGAQKLILMNSKITQGKQFQFKGLHQYLDCQLSKVKSNYYLTSLFFISILNLEIDGLIIIQSQSYNYPLLYYKSQDEEKQQQFESIYISNLFIDQNVLLITKSQQLTAIIFIESSQETLITFNNSKFYGNILHEYFQDTFLVSALLLNINSYLGTVIINNSTFYKNIVLNSTHSIIQIRSLKLTMSENIFQFNNIFDYQLIQPQILWGENLESETIYIEDINWIFQIQSLTGNGQFLVEELNISECKFEQSQGSLGGAFHIIGQKNTIVKIFNSSFYNLSTKFQTNNGYGGAIYFDGTSSLSLIVNIFKVTIEYLYAQQFGGFLYLKSQSSQISINIQEINLSNVYAKNGSVAYLEFSFYSKSQIEVQINNIFFNNNKKAFINYLNQYNSLSSLEQLTLLNNRFLFYIDSASKVICQNFRIENLIFESAFIINNAAKLKFLKVKIINSLIINNLVSIIPNQYQKNILLFQNLEVQNITIISQITNHSCQTINRQERNIQIFCQESNTPLTLPKLSQSTEIDFGQCITDYVEELMKNEERQIENSLNAGLFLFLGLTIESQLNIENSNLISIKCTSCQYGLFYFYFSEIKGILKNQRIQDLKVINSTCGNLGCINIKKDQQKLQRILLNEENNQGFLVSEFIIHNYICLNNKANNGSCINIENTKVMISNSIFQFNNASNFGGAVYAINEQVFIINSQIQNNEAQIGGGIYLQDKPELNYTKLGTKIIDNTGRQFGNDCSSIPSGLTLTLEDESSCFNTKIIQQTDQLLIEQINFSTFQENNYILLPSGQQIQNYQKFSTFTREIMAVNKDKNVIKNLEGTFCEIQSRMINSSQEEQNSNFTNNYTNIINITFNSTTQDYNLDQLIIYFDNELPEQIKLQLQFICSSIVLPIYNQNYPYDIIDTHKNYKLRLNVKSLSCQYGEIKNYTDFSCQLCDGNQGLFSLQLNQLKCELKDDVSTISVKSPLLNLRPGFWRPYFNNNEIAYCLNLPQSCLGGWMEGDQSCFMGHLGALCEQCDIYNLRGDGYFSVNQQYSCGSCLDQQKNSIIITLVSIWTLVTILLSVTSTLKAIEVYVQFCQIKKLGLVVKQNQNESAILIKMLTNYLQIIGFIATFQLKLPSNLESTINIASSPIQTMSYSLDCFLTSMFNIEIHYARMIWQIIMPFIYINFFFLCYTIAAQLKMVILNKSVITTTFIYMYIYLQPSLIGGFVQLISYRQISGYKWILANVAYRFDTYEHQKWMLQLCFPMLLFLAILVPTFFLYELFKNRQNLDNKSTRLQFGYLYNEYTKTVFYWEVIKIAQKEFMIIFLTYFQDSIVIKATIILLILAIYLELTNRSLPYKSNTLNKLDYSSTSICLISIGLAIGLFVAYQQDLIEIQIPYFFVLGIINLNFVYNITIEIVNQLIKEKADQYSEKLDIIRGKILKCFPFINRIRFFNKMLKNRQEQRIRVAKRFHKLKKFLIPQAQRIINYKEQSLQLANENSNKQNENVPFSSRISKLLLENQNPINYQAEILFSSQRNSYTSKILDKQSLQQNRKAEETLENNPIRHKKLPSIAQVSLNDNNKSGF